MLVKPPFLAVFASLLLMATATADPGDDVTAYNGGVGDYRADRLDDAAAKFQAAAASADTSLAAKARYNLGNVRFRIATSAIGQGEIASLAPEVKTLAIENLTAAIDQYRSSLRLNPDDADARANIEKAARLIEPLSAQPPPSEPDSSGGQDGDDDQQGESEDQSESSSSKPEDAGGDAESQQDDGTEQTEGSEQTDAAQESDETNQARATDQSPTSNESPQSHSNPDKADAKAEADADADADAEEEENQSANADPIEPNNNGELSATNPTNGEMNQQQPVPVPAGGITEQEARKMLQAIRDRDMLRRLQRQAELRNRRISVDRDW